MLLSWSKAKCHALRLLAFCLAFLVHALQRLNTFVTCWEREIKGDVATSFV